MRSTRFAAIGAALSLIVVASLALWLFSFGPLAGVDLASPASLAESLRSAGAWSRLLFAALVVMQVIVFFIPDEPFLMLGGYLFGMAEGCALSVVAIAIGSIASFLIGRYLGRPVVRAFLKPRLYDRFEGFLDGPNARRAAFALYLIPGIPKDPLGYMAGASRIGFLPFIAATTLARVPNCLAFVGMGVAAGLERYLELGSLAIGVIILAAAAYARKERLLAFARSLVERKT